MNTIPIPYSWYISIIIKDKPFKAMLDLGSQPLFITLDSFS